MLLLMNLLTGKKGENVDIDSIPANKNGLDIGAKTCEYLQMY